MTPSLALLLLLALVGCSSGETVSLNCVQVPGALTQIDAGNGQVVGVNSAGNVYYLNKGRWSRLPGALTHVTIGAGGCWGTDSNNYIYKLVDHKWMQTDGRLRHVDTGVGKFITGASLNDDVFCLNQDATESVKDGSTLPWVHIPGKLVCYANGPLGSWGVNRAGDIYYRFDTTPSSCQGSNWHHVAGKLSMIEVGSNGEVIGVNSLGDMYRRDGITESNPVGSSWSQLTFGEQKFKYVSLDQDTLWVITREEAIYKCPL